MWVPIHMCMEAMLGISLYSYLYLKLAKTLCLSFYLLRFSSTKSENKRAEQALAGSGWLACHAHSTRMVGGWHVMYTTPGWGWVEKGVAKAALSLDALP
jgi:hypothetical protein